MLIPQATPASFIAALLASFVTSLGALSDSGDPVPFAPTEGRLADWLGLTVYAVLVVAVSLVALRMARDPGGGPQTTGSPVSHEEAGPGTPAG